MRCSPGASAAALLTRRNDVLVSGFGSVPIRPTRRPSARANSGGVWPSSAVGTSADEKYWASTPKNFTRLPPSSSVLSTSASIGGFFSSESCAGDDVHVVVFELGHHVAQAAAGVHADLAGEPRPFPRQTVHAVLPVGDLALLESPRSSRPAKSPGDSRRLRPGAWSPQTPYPACRSW